MQRIRQRLMPAGSHVDSLPDLVVALQGRPEIRFAVLIGSAAKGLPFHDLDVAVMVDRAYIPAEHDIDYMLDTAQRLEQRAPCPVDVSVINRAPLGFRYNASRGFLLTAQDLDEYDRFRERTWDEYFDFLPVANLYLRETACAQ